MDQKLRTVITKGVESADHVYDAERYEELSKLALRLDGADEAELVGIRASMEALAKTGWSLTRSEDQRENYKQVIELLRALGDPFFGPATEPRTALDNKLQSVSSRYVTPKVGINAVVDDGSGRLLMVQRADRGEWTIPGGYADVGLSGAEVAVKEAFEETGLEVEVNSLLGEWDNLLHAGQRIPQYTLLYHCWVTGGELAYHPEEALDIQWFKRGELPSKIWQEGDPWLEIALRAVEGVKQGAYFDKPRG